MTITPATPAQKARVQHFIIGSGITQGCYTGITHRETDDAITIRLYSAGCLHGYQEISREMITEVRPYGNVLYSMDADPHTSFQVEQAEDGSYVAIARTFRWPDRESETFIGTAPTLEEAIAKMSKLRDALTAKIEELAARDEELV